MTTFREFCARSAHFGKKGGWDESRGARVFFCLVNHATFRQLYKGRFSPNLVTKRNPERHFRNFHFRGHFPPKSEIENRSNRHLLRAGYRSWDALQSAERYCLLHAVVQGPGSFRGPVNFSLQHTVAELRGVKVAQFSDFGLFSPYRTPKTYLPVTSLQHRGYIAECFRFFRVIVKGPKWCLPAPEISCDFWRGAEDPQTCPNFRLWQMAIPYRMLVYTARQIWTKDV